MRLLESLRWAEEMAEKQTRHGMEQAEELWAQAESRIRRKMRIHPRRTRTEVENTESQAVRRKAA